RLRRHTTCYRDWSSDVCSSDLNHRLQPSLEVARHVGRHDRVRQLPGRAVRWKRLPLEDVEGGAADPPLPKGLDQRLLIDRGAPESGRGELREQGGERAGRGARK